MGVAGGAQGSSAGSWRPASAALVLPSFASGGAERVMLNLAGGLAARGVAVRLIALDGRGPLRTLVPAEVEVVDLDRPRARRAGPSLVAALRRRPVDLVVGSQTHVNVLLALLRPLLPSGTRLVLREPALHTHAPRPARRDRALGRALGRADVVIASTPAMQEHLVATASGRARTVLVPNPVDVESLRAAARTGAAVPSSGAGARLVSVGRLIGSKALADLLRALGGSGTAHTLTVVGDGPERAALEQMRDALGLAGRVTFAGRIDDPSELARTVAGADLLVHPSLAEGLPNAVLEALALGTPVLATTDLTVLGPLAAELGPGALRLVPRDTLADALTQVAPRTDTTLRPCLLPERFRPAAVVDALLDAADAAGGR